MRRAVRRGRPAAGDARGQRAAAAGQAAAMTAGDPARDEPAPPPGAAGGRAEQARASAVACGHGCVPRRRPRADPQPHRRTPSRAPAHHAATCPSTPAPPVLHHTHGRGGPPGRDQEARSSMAQLSLLGTKPSVAHPGHGAAGGVTRGPGISQLQPEAWGSSGRPRSPVPGWPAVPRSSAPGRPSRAGSCAYDSHLATRPRSRLRRWQTGPRRGLRLEGQLRPRPAPSASPAASSAADTARPPAWWRAARTHHTPPGR